MAEALFTYDTSLTSNVHRVRFHIGDTDPDNGPRPNNAIYSDQEIAAVLSYEGTWQRAVAAMFETLGAEWRLYPTFSADQFSLSSSHISRGYMEQAQHWRDQYGFSGGASGLQSVSPFRKDGYSAVYGTYRVDGSDAD